MNRNAYLGPFAEVLVPAESMTEAFNRLSVWEDMAEGDSLFHNWGRDRPPLVTLEGKRYHRFCFFPLAGRPGAPVRHFIATEILGIEDLRDASPKAELDWFATAFAAELARVSEQLGRPIVYRWGIVGWRE